MCGGNRGILDEVAIKFGLSPRVRGKRDVYYEIGEWQRSIPACAGETPSPFPRLLLRWVYPRVCGGNQPLLLVGEAAYGLSPRVRGKRKRCYRVSNW